MIADTHGLLRPEAEHCLAGVSHIIHAGDIGAQAVMDGLCRIAPVTAIRGNVDRGAWAERFPETQTLHLGGHSFYILHDLNELTIDPAERGIDVVVSGHSHRVRIETTKGVLYLNPGSESGECREATLQAAHSAGNAGPGFGRTAAARHP